MALLRDYRRQHYKRIDTSTSEEHIKSIQTTEQRDYFPQDDQRESDCFPKLYILQSPNQLITTLFTMSDSNNQQGQSSQGSDTPTTTSSQPEAPAQPTAGQNSNSSGSLQQTGASVMRQQLGQYYLYMANTQGQTGQAGRGSPGGSQGGQSSGSSQGK